MRVPWLWLPLSIVGLVCARPPVASAELTDAGGAHAAAPPIAAADAGAPQRFGAIDDLARVLAGLPVEPSSPLAALEEQPAFKAHATELAAAWARLDEHRLEPMHTWGEAQITPRIQPALPVVYLFGGPDAISVATLYPDAPRSILCGLELPGELPALAELSPEELERGLTGLRATIRTTVDLSYFITSEVGGQLKRSKIQGTVPVLLLFLARHGDRILDAAPVWLDRSGAVHRSSEGQGPANAVQGWRIAFLRGGQGEPRELFYFRNDVTNEALPQSPGLMPFLASQGPFNAFLKAASFILHDRHFSIARDLLLAHAASILQDDSGLPYRAFPPAKWDLLFFGEYTPGKNVFQDHFQPELKKAWDEAPRPPLPFKTGYRHVSGSNLWLALPHAASAAPDAGTVPKRQ